MAVELMSQRCGAGHLFGTQQGHQRNFQVGQDGPQRLESVPSPVDRGAAFGAQVVVVQESQRLGGHVRQISHDDLEVGRNISQPVGAVHAETVTLAVAARPLAGLRVGVAGVDFAIGQAPFDGCRQGAAAAAQV